MRILLYTGKGGAGKTTIAAATAVRCAESNKRTLVVGTDSSQSLADCLNSPLTDEPAEIAPNLWAQEIDPLDRLEKLWPALEPMLCDGLGGKLSGTALEELTLGPGVGDVIRLLALKQHCDENAYDVLIWDAGASQSALQLLGYPESASWWLQRLFCGKEEQGLALEDSTGILGDQLTRLRAALADGAECSIRVVMAPEQLGLRETQRAVTFASLYGYNVDAVIVNRQKRIPRNIAEMFAAWPILYVTLYDRDVVGHKLLSEMALALFPPPMDPADVFMSGQAERLSRDGQGYVLSIKLPFVHEDDIDLLQHRTELILQVGRMRRVLQLPSALEGLQAADAVLEEGTLEVHFR
ncbi:MAG: ArsA family ATPase [Chloroflexota bacterium]|nr:ArsA family ATPase [Chloroflexota bacterium]